MKTRAIFALAIPAAAVGLLAQDNVVVYKSKAADETRMIAQGAVGMVGFSAAEPGNVRFMTQEFSYNGRTVTNAPYSAEEKTESVQTLADGNRITNTTTSRIYRDNQGRTRREMTLQGFGGDEQHTIITITDPVAGVNYTLDPQGKVAHQMPGMAMLATIKADTESKMMEAKMKAEAFASTTKPNATFIRRAPAPNVKHEDLGGNVIEGVSATGTRETSTIDAHAMGNEQPIVITSERWYSPELSLEVKSVHNDPRMGQTTHTLTNINRAEPDAALFKVPQDYTVDEGKAGVQIHKFDVRSDR